MAKQDSIPTAKPRNDAYTGMLVISLVAMIIGCALLFVDYNRYPTSKPELKGLEPITAAGLSKMNAAPAPPPAAGPAQPGAPGQPPAAPAGPMPPPMGGVPPMPKQ